MDMELLTSAAAEEDAIEVDDYYNNEAPNFEGESCGICMDVVIDRGVLDCCNHWFCFACIDNWATITNLCPLCQNEFQLITCVPVYDTLGTSKLDDDLYSRDDDWCIEAKNNTLAFPSYYIDENAVICLDGDGCKIRSGSATTEGNPNLDTSIACDSCDIWYHAFCVGFDVESTSDSTWLCPRCVVNELSNIQDGNLLQKHNKPSSPEDVNTLCYTEDSYSKKVSVTVADDGETALVVSMVGENKLTEELGENPPPDLEVDEDLKSNMYSLEDNSQKVEYPLLKESSTQSMSEAQELKPTMSCETSSSFPSNGLFERELIMVADQPMSEHDNSDGTQSSSGKLSSETQIPSDQCNINSNMGLHLGLSVGSFLSVPVDKIVNATEDQYEDESHQNSSDENLYKADKTGKDADEDALRMSGVKRKLSKCRANSDHSCFDSDDIILSADGGEVKPMIQNEASKRKIRAEGRSKSIPLKGERNKYVPNDMQNGNVVKVPGNGRLKRRSEEDNTVYDIMNIVKGTACRPSKGLGCPNPDAHLTREQENVAGLRMKKIMKRATVDKESSVVVQELRKEIREAVCNKSTKDIGENLFDPKLLAAFRAAVTVPKTEPSRTVSHLAMKTRRSKLQKGKVRENLTKKIYATSNGRRKRAWDRDCEVEFWKHRCVRTTKPEKIETLKSVLNLLRHGSEGMATEKSSEDQATDPILSRLYLADTSVLPRKDDVKPLLALTTSGDSESNSKKHTWEEKSYKSSLDNHSQVLPQVVPTKETCGIRSDVPSSKANVASSKIRLPKQSERPLTSSDSSKSEMSKEISVNSNDKIDKRKWALEVLARKTTGASGSATNEKKEDAAVLKGNYPLLVQLPIEMRPVLSPNCHNKIPMSVRQAQLYRLTEHFLRKANLVAIRRCAETELAVVDAANIEKELADRSNSKLVYLNLCSQEVLRRSQNRKFTKEATDVDSSLQYAVPVGRSVHTNAEVPTDPQINEALRNAGLLSDSPPNSPDHKMEIYDPSTNIGEEEPDNVLEIDSDPDLDIYGDFEYSLEGEDYIGASETKDSNVEQEERMSKLKVVLSTLRTERSEDALHFEKTENIGNAEGSKSSSHMIESQIDPLVRSSIMEGGTEVSRVHLEPLVGEEVEELSAAECEELYGPDTEPLLKKLPGESSHNLNGVVDTKVGAETEGPQDSKSHRVKNTSELGNRICSEVLASTGRKSSGSEGSTNHSEMGENVRKGKNQLDSMTSISKKVEAYIKEHIRPLCKSGVITVDQYRWAVSKTTEKVVKYHSKAKNANFLIKEGEKVKKLAEQYVETAKKKEKSELV